MLSKYTLLSARIAPLSTRQFRRARHAASAKSDTVLLLLIYCIMLYVLQHYKRTAVCLATRELRDYVFEPGQYLFSFYIPSQSPHTRNRP